MNQQEFEEYLESQPKVAGTTPVGEFVKNAFDQDERVVLPECYWRYIDWVHMVEGEDMVAWIKRCDLYREDKTLSENLMEWLYWDMCDRLRKGDNFPRFMPIPEGYQE